MKDFFIDKFEVISGFLLLNLEKSVQITRMSCVWGGHWRVISFNRCWILYISWHFNIWEIVYCLVLSARAGRRLWNYVVPRFFFTFVDQILSDLRDIVVVVHQDFLHGILESLCLLNWGDPQFSIEVVSDSRRWRLRILEEEVALAIKLTHHQRLFHCGLFFDLIIVSFDFFFVRRKVHILWNALFDDYAIEQRFWSVE